MEFTVPPEVVARIGGPKALDEFVAKMKAAHERAHSPAALAEALRSHVEALERHGLDPDHLWPPRAR